MTDTPTEALKPCPFCGKAPAFVPDTSYGAARVICPDDNDCPVQPMSEADLRGGEAAELAIVRWNTRATMQSSSPSALVARLRWLQDRCESGEQSERYLARQELQGKLPEIIAALSQAAPAGEDAWQPIETAPRGDDPKDTNGPPILIWRDGWPSAYEGFWYAPDQAWFFANLDSEYGSPEYPTHWMSLPKPPATLSPTMETDR